MPYEKEIEIPIGHATYFLAQGDLTQATTRAIVNAANSSLLGGGGVDGAIHRAGGPRILEECQHIRDTHGECAPGQAVITSGGDLPAEFVIHTVGPIWAGGNNDEDQTLRQCYRNSLLLARKQKIESVSFPSISTGAYRFPVAQAARSAQEEVTFFLKAAPGFTRVGFVLFDDATYQAYREALGELHRFGLE